MNDRFKYQVKALMGVYDPPIGAVDDEFQSGNIVGAMVDFPASYSFTAVGRTEGDNDVQNQYVQEVLSVLSPGSGENNGVQYEVKPRGNNFIKVSASVMVNSAAEISAIQQGLSKIKQTVMQF
eukprot:CAMPEP_0113944648 /NCGR_PEP_ID=MMETSP1339-20121228/35119_1 /TAXON_ID=94617 /ORGANISM="Fibrocapsa japonica" /LENGTH=122 /DNA_ID=CAMNT_0000949923 /DNA_START=262 /DNA_END=630 /DNA_ORIENTATION=+ /assembly_acc=CAM_ASM_000762